MLSYLHKVMRDTKDRGASAVEYGLMVAAIAAVIVAIVFGLGGVVRGVFSNSCDNIAAQVNSQPDAPAGADAADCAPVVGGG